MLDPLFDKKKEAKVVALIDKICESVNINRDDGSAMSNKQISDRADRWAAEGGDILTSEGDEDMDPAFFEEVERYFKNYEEKEHKMESLKEFRMIEAFIKEEQVSGKNRREAARLLAASEEVRVAAELAVLKANRLGRANDANDEALREKIANAEKSHTSRKMVISKAARLATSDCRKQFKRVRDFFQSLHDNRKAKLRKQYDRSIKIQAMLHRLRKTDTRVMELQQQTAERIFRKKESDMMELNMVQNLEESTYLETIISLLDDVQEAKECAADDYFKLQIKNLKLRQANHKAREKEVNDMRAKSMLEMAELIAKYVKEEMEDREEDEATKEMVDRTDRERDFQASNSTVLLSVSDLYDTILWSVATGTLGLSSSDSDSFNSYFDDEDDDEDEEEQKKPSASNETNDAKNKNLRLEDDDLAGPEHMQLTTNRLAGHNEGIAIIGSSDSGSIQSRSTANTTDVNTSDNLSPVGHIFVKELRRSIREKEKKMEKRHAAERKAERKKFRAEAKKLKEHHQKIIDALLAKCVDERARLRDAISRRMATLEQNQKRSTQTLQEEIESSVKQMEGAWSEHKRLEEEQKDSFNRAQALVSAQVFHEVRNALSSVVAMSEMTSSLQQDPTVTSRDLVDSVSEMLDQNKEVVNYSLSMLNNILDVSKIKAGSFETTMGFFDLQDLVHRATTMQVVKAQTRGVKMSFTPLPDSQIAYSDKDIVSRIITNFISNAVKFTTAGVVQPFVCPLEDFDPSVDKRKPRSIRIGDKNEKKTVYADVRYVAVGVADTGPGLSRDLLKVSEAGLLNSNGSKINSGAKNSGFGLHLAHQLAGTLGSLVHLTDLQSFKKFSNFDLRRILDSDSSSPEVCDSSSGAESVYNEDIPGKGTVLYITIPVVYDGNRAVSLLQRAPGVGHGLDVAFKKYVFSPKPAPNSANGCFRILVADDVAMLRKGLMRLVLDNFKKMSDCPVSVGTACTAEDALRAVASNACDILICDHQFGPPNRLRRLAPEREKSRDYVDSHGNAGYVRQSIAEFFKTESFTISPGDGAMSGLDALLQLTQKKSSPDFSIPILVLHSGHQIQLPRNLGIISIQKPMKRDDFVPLLERNAENLIESGMCVEEQKGDDTVILTRGGAQLFIKQISMASPNSKYEDVDAKEKNKSRKRQKSTDRKDEKAGSKVSDELPSQQKQKEGLAKSPDHKKLKTSKKIPCEDLHNQE